MQFDNAHATCSSILHRPPLMYCSIHKYLRHLYSNLVMDVANFGTYLRPLQKIREMWYHCIHYIRRAVLPTLLVRFQRTDIEITLTN